MWIKICIYYFTHEFVSNRYRYVAISVETEPIFAFGYDLSTVLTRRRRRYKHRGIPNLFPRSRVYATLCYAKYSFVPTERSWRNTKARWARSDDTTERINANDVVVVGGCGSWRTASRLHSTFDSSESDMTSNNIRSASDYTYIKLAPNFVCHVTTALRFWAEKKQR